MYVVANYIHKLSADKVYGQRGIAELHQNKKATGIPYRFKYHEILKS